MFVESERLDNIIENNNQITSLQVVFTDIVKYSARSVASQRGVIERFRACLGAALNDLASLSEELAELVGRHPKFHDDTIKLPTGDGAAVAFSYDAVADLHLLFARRLLEEVDRLNRQTPCPVFEREEWCDCHDNFGLRVGLAAGGESIIYKDINGGYNVAGKVINLAARVMDLADGGQIILTDKAYEKLTTLKPRMKEYFRELKGVRVKREFIRAYQYFGEGETYINQKFPTEVFLRGFPTKADLDEVLERGIVTVTGHFDTGLERVLAGSEVRFEEMRATLAKTLSARSLDDRESIYEAFVAAVREAQHYIKIVRLGSREAEPAVLQALADKVNNGVRYEVVVVLDQQDQGHGFMTNHRDLLKQLHPDKARRYYRPRRLVMEHPICFDVLIADDKYVGLGFARLGAAEDLESAILLQNTTDKIAKHFREWFEEVIWPRARSL